MNGLMKPSAPALPAVPSTNSAANVPSAMRRRIVVGILMSWPPRAPDARTGPLRKSLIYNPVRRSAVRERGQMSDATRARQDRILANQDRIVGNQRRIISNQAQLKQILSNQ